MCLSHSGVVEVLGALDVLRGVPGGAELFEDLDAFERVVAGVASRGPSNSLKMSCFSSSRVWNSCLRSLSPSGFSKCVKEKKLSVSMMPMMVAHVSMMANRVGLQGEAGIELRSVAAAHLFSVFG